MASSRITSLGEGTPKPTDLFVCVDVTDEEMSPTGTNKKYLRSEMDTYILGQIVLDGEVTGPVDATVIQTNTVTNQKMSKMAAHTIKGNNLSVTNDPIDLTITQLKSELAYGSMANQSSSSVSITGGTIEVSAINISAFSSVGVVHNNALGVLSSSLIVNADVSASAGIVDSKLATISTAGKVSNSATTATSVSTPSAIVLRDGSGNFSAGTITANLVGNASTATTTTNFSGSLSGNVTGTQSATVIASGVITNSMINASAGIVDTKLATISTAGKVSNSATTATALNTASAIMARDSSGNFSASLFTATDGIYLPSSGGTQTKLNYSGDEEITFQMTGAVTPTFDFPVKFSRVGKIVVMQWGGFQKSRTGVDILFTADLVPARFRPTFGSGDPLVWDVKLIDGTSLTAPSSFSAGTISFGPMGNIEIGRLDGTNFTSTYCGIFGGSISYLIE